MSLAKDRVRIAALGDLHYTRTSAASMQPVFAQLAAAADILLLCGDLTDYGAVEEARALVRDLTGAVKVPIVTVLGNHDYEGGLQEEIRQILTDGGITVLDGDSCEVHGVGFAGIKGFAGGFGRGTLGPWGEKVVKAFVREAVDEALKLETALARLRTQHRIALLHYAPIAATCEGEPPEIYPFLGCSRLEEPITRYPVTAVFHGHAHNGRPEGRTRNGVPVFNVSLSLMRTIDPARPFKIIEIVDRPPASVDADRRMGSDRRTHEVLK
ncbi:MAG TPA: metallophosphoesterase [Vicinamibacterales bacterium]|jgi:Icc-related predicted phosphoesterase|nr:metallophosphoesterase [Vicinamibacterales bacterium]